MAVAHAQMSSRQTAVCLWPVRGCALLRTSASKWAEISILQKHKKTRNLAIKNLQTKLVWLLFMMVSAKKGILQ